MGISFEMWFMMKIDRIVSIIIFFAKKRVGA